MRARVVSLFATLFMLIVAGVPCVDVAAQATPMSAACAATPIASGTTFPLTITDDAGRQVTLDRPPSRIVSIAPSNTELLFALGLDDRVVGVDTYSNFPPEATRKPQMGSYLEPDLERIVAAAPDLVLAAETHVQTVLPALESLGLTTVVLEPADLDGVFADMTLLGQVTDNATRAGALICALQTRVAALEAKVAGAPKPRVFFELSPDLYSAGPGSFIDDLIARAGGDNVAADAGASWPQLSAEAVVSANPEVILLVDHGAGVTPAQVASRPGWQHVAAVMQGRIVTIDPDLVTRPGPRLVDGLEAIAAALHPDLVPGPDA
jgi:iron complex transport system substrate-binding protein